MEHKIKVNYIGPVSTDWGAIKYAGGVASHIQGLLTEIPKYGVKANLLADNTSYYEKVQEISVKDLSIRRFVRPTNKYFIPGIRKLGVANLIQLAGKLLLIGGREHIPLNYLLKFIVQAANFRKFLEDETFEILHLHHAEFRQFLCQRVINVSKPVVVTVHSATVLIDPKPAWIKQLVIENYSNAHWLIVVSNYVRDMISQYISPETKLTVIPNGVNTNNFHPADKTAVRKQLGLDPSCKYAFFSGRLTARKGVDPLIKAFSKLVEAHQNLHCVIVGEGPDRDSLQNLISHLGIRSKIHLLGMVKLSDMPSWYQAADLFVLPSKSEGLSISILEALASGLPVITSKPSIGDHDAVIPGKTGLLVHYGNPNDLAQAINTLIASEDIRRKMSIQAREMAVKKFDWSVIAKRTADFYQTVLKDDRR